MLWYYVIVLGCALAAPGQSPTTVPRPGLCIVSQPPVATAGSLLPILSQGALEATSCFNSLKSWATPGPGASSTSAASKILKSIHMTDLDDLDKLINSAENAANGIRTEFESNDVTPYANGFETLASKLTNLFSLMGSRISDFDKVDMTRFIKDDVNDLTEQLRQLEQNLIPPISANILCSDLSKLASAASVVNAAATSVCSLYGVGVPSYPALPTNCYALCNTQVPTISWSSGPFGPTIGGSCLLSSATASPDPT